VAHGLLDDILAGMRNLWILAVLSAGALCAQTPNLSGVWKADLSKSKFGPQTPTNYLLIIDEQSPKLTAITGSWTDHGEQRSKVEFTTDGKPGITAVRGIPTRVTASWQGNTLNVTAETAGGHGVTKETYELSSDGNTLTDTTSTTSDDGRPPRQGLVVLTKQPDSAGEPLRKPEELASAHFKNVKTPLKDLPESEFIDAMRYFTFALGKECGFCHVAGKFDADDKMEKKVARKMIAMTHSINQENFEGKREVRCFTCHQGHEEPLRRPLFADEASKSQEHK
jgi:Photosynthetic reaction centre cytochrome C subunit